MRGLPRILPVIFISIVSVPATAQDLRKGLTGRVWPYDAPVQYKTNGAAGGPIDAGYFRLIMTSSNLETGTQCPKLLLDKKPAASASTDQYAALKDVLGSNAVFVIGAKMRVQGRAAGSEFGNEMPLLAVTNAGKRNCGGPWMLEKDGIPLDLTNASFLVPADPDNPQFVPSIQLRIEAAYESKPNKERVGQLVAGITAAFGVASAPVGLLVGKLAATGRDEITSRFTEANKSPYSYVFPAKPEKSHALFVYLGFDKFDQKDSTKFVDGITFEPDYVATLWRQDARYYGPTIKLTAAEIVQGKVIREGATDRSIKDVLVEAALWNPLIESRDLAEFDRRCGDTRLQLAKRGLSPVDSDAAVWAAIEMEGAQAIKENVGASTCLDAARLGKVGIIPRVKPVEVPPDFNDAKDRVQEFASAIKRADPAGSAYLAAKVDLIVNPGAMRDAAGTLAAVGQSPSAIFGFLQGQFSDYGCIVPRKKATILKLAATYPLDAKALVLGMIMKAKVDGSPYVISFVFNGTPDGKNAPIQAVAIDRLTEVDKGTVSEMNQITESKICPA